MISKTKNAFFCLTLGLSFSSFAKDLSTIAFDKEMTRASLDFHSMMDLDLNSSSFFESTKTIKEKRSDKDLAALVIIINRAPKGSAIDAQRAKVYIEGKLINTFTVSTGKTGYESRTGYYRPVYTNHLRVYDSYYSSKYDSLMDKAIFYSGGYAIHHTDAVKNLGQRASHGCVRFHIDDIAWLNERAMDLGSSNYELRKWSHDNHKGKSKYNIHYKGLETLVSPINSFTGVIDMNKTTKSLDMVILVKDQRDTDR